MKVPVLFLMLTFLTGFAFAAEPENSYVTRKEFNDFSHRVAERNLSSYISVKDYIDSRFTSLSETTRDAREAMEKRLDGMNEFRNALRDQGNKFVSLDEFRAISTQRTADIKRLDSDIKSLQISRAVIDGKASQSETMLALFISLFGMLTGIASLIISVKMKARNGKLERHD